MISRTELIAYLDSYLEIHALDDMGDVFAHRTDRVEMFRLDGKHSLQRDQTKSRFKSHDPAASSGYSN